MKTFNALSTKDDQPNLAEEPGLSALQDCVAKTSLEAEQELSRAPLPIVQDSLVIAGKLITSRIKELASKSSNFKDNSDKIVKTLTDLEASNPTSGEEYHEKIVELVKQLSITEKREIGESLHFENVWKFYTYHDSLQPTWRKENLKMQLKITNIPSLFTY